MSPIFASPSENAVPIHALSQGATSAWSKAQTPDDQAFLETHGFTGGSGQICMMFNADQTLRQVLFGLGDEVSRKRNRFVMAKAATALPKGVYEIASGLEGVALQEAATGWLLAGYVFDRYKEKSAPQAQLVCPKSLDAPRIEAIVAGEILSRDLINTPANDMGPDELEAAARDLADCHGATFHVIREKDGLAADFPLIHAVGRASTRRPRLLDLKWGAKGPKITLVGKGVCFDTGGLNLKPGASMGLMKKDMGGSAAVLGLAHMIMATKTPVQLRVLIPAVENAVDGSAMRPGDVLTGRNGKTVEINNTDAEGRLVLADALAYASEDHPDRIISMATLTGAARVAVGPDLAPYYSGEDTFVAALETAAKDVFDPVWRMPFWDPYEAMIAPAIADLDNAPAGGFAGSITAALFLRNFVEKPDIYSHFDIYGWQPVAAPARPKGGVGQATRAIFEALSAEVK